MRSVSSSAAACCGDGMSLSRTTSFMHATIVLAYDIYGLVAACMFVLLRSWQG
jgi:hypothetical protein